MSKLFGLISVVAIIASILTPLCVLGAEFVIEVEDALGRRVSIYYPPRRVVSLAPSLTEVLIALDLDGYLIGTDSFSINSWFMNASERLKSRGVTEVGGYWWSTINVEKVIELRPDIVLADRDAHKPLLEVFERFNVTVFYFHSGRSINDVYNNIYTVGLIFNKTSEAQKLVEEIEDAFGLVREQLKPYMGTKVLVVIDFWQGIWVAGKATYLDDLIARMGLVNVATVHGWSPVNIEIVAKWSPDVIIVACPYADEGILKSSGLLDLNKRVVTLNSSEVDILLRPGPTILLAPAVLYGAISGRRPNTLEAGARFDFTSASTYLVIPIVAIICGAIGYYLGKRFAR